MAKKVYEDWKPQNKVTTTILAASGVQGEIEGLVVQRNGVCYLKSKPKKYYHARR